MKKIVLIIFIVFLIIVFWLYALKIKQESKVREIKKYNTEYEAYLNKTIYGADLATLINKAVNSNEKNHIKKDKNKHYIENEKDSIKIEIKINLTNKTYSMEEFYNNDTAEFVKFFNAIEFKCNEILYHKETGKVSKMIFEQTEK